MTCLDEEAVLELLEGALSAEERATCEEHIASCAACRALVSAAVRGEGSAADGYRLGDAIEPGAEIHRFRVMRLLGKGRTGEVYLCRDTRLGRRVALKVVRPEALGSAAAVERFLAEARTTARFNHPHIVTIHEADVWRGLPYLALEYLEGQTLRQRMGVERLGRGTVIRVGMALAQALEEAHAGDVVHGDLKPANVILPTDGRLRVVDFGLARAAAAEQGDGGAACGTPAYMAPELWQGAAPAPAADIWALGVMLYELLLGRRPFSAGSLAELRRLVTAGERAPRCPDEVGAGLAELVAACLEREPSRRPDAAAVRQRLTHCLQPRSGGARDGEDEARGPFRGLLPFDEQHAAAFFGREPETAAFLELLRDQGVLTVVGPTGVGKTSFVQAGVVPRLREQAEWQVLRLRPGAAPFVALAGVLARATGQERAALERELREAPLRLNLLLRRLGRERGARVLLLVDQLEELCTHGVDAATQREFLRALSGAGDDPGDPVRVVCTLRDDFLGRLAVDPRAREPLGRVSVLRNPEEAALSRVVTEPLEAVGYAYDDPELPGLMVREVRGEVSALPLLQFTTRLLWEGRDRQARRLLAEVYRQAGGVAGALARHADSVLDALPAGRVVVARALLLRLVNELGTRRGRAGQELLSGLERPVAEQVLDHLVQGRLVAVRRTDADGVEEADGVTYELAHESLLRSWDRLAGWIASSRDELRLLRELGQAAELWDGRGRRPQELWQGDALAEAERTLAHGGAEEIPGRVRLFLQQARALEARTRARRRLRWGAAAALLVAAALVSSLAAVTFLRQKRLAVTQRAEAQLLSARSALERGDPLEARALLRVSLQSRDSARARLLWWRLRRSPLVWSRTLGAPLWAVAFSPAGDLVAAGGAGRTVYLLDARTRQVRARLRGHTDQVLSLAFAPDGKTLASGSWNGEVRLWDLSKQPTGRTLAVKHSGAVWDLAFSADGQQLASGSYDKTVRLWRPSDGTSLRTLGGHGSGVYAVAFSPDGETLASGSYDGVVRLFATADAGQKPRELRGHGAGVYGVAFSPDGKRLATAGADAAVRLWRLADGSTERQLTGFGDTVDSVAFSPDGAQLACGGYDRTARIFSVASGAQLRVLSGHDGAVVGVAFSPDGKLLATAGRDQAVSLWRADMQGEPAAGAGHGASVWSVAFSPDGAEVASGGRDGSLRLWGAADGRLRRVLSGHPDGVLAVAYSPDGQLLASAGADHMVRLWERRTGRERRLLSGHSGEVFAVAFSPDGERLASAGYDKTVRLWHAPAGRAAEVLRGHEASVYGLSFSPDGRTLASGSYDKTVRLWDLSRARAPRVLRGHGDTVYGVAFSPDGRALASGGADRTVRVWDLASGLGRVLATLPKRVYWLAFHPDGQRVGVPSADGVARLLSLSAKSPRELRGHRGEVNMLRFSPDGARAATASDDGTVRVWDLASGASAWGAAPPRAKGSSPDPAPGSSLRGAPASKVEATAQAPMNTVAVGFESGLLGIWDRASGQPLYQTRLHGPVTHLKLDGATLSATTELGQRQAWDLSVLSTSRCQLLRQIWDEARVTWKDGRVIHQGTPADHACAQ